MLANLGSPRFSLLPVPFWQEKSIISLLRPASSLAYLLLFSLPWEHFGHPREGLFGINGNVTVLCLLAPRAAPRGEHTPQQGGGFTTGGRNGPKPLEKGCREHATAAPDTTGVAAAACAVLWECLEMGTQPSLPLLPLLAF